MKQMPSQEKIFELFEYDESTGGLIWKPIDRSKFRSPAAFASFNSRCLGKIAGYEKPLEYRLIRIEGQGYFAHRLIWVYFYGDGSLPQDMQIDHIDQNKRNNRIDNLRLVTNRENQMNRPISKNNKSGIIGVRLVKKTGLWRAYIQSRKNSIYLGEFKNISDAISIRKSAEISHGFHPNHGSSPN